MAEKLLMIALSPTMETGTIGSWQKLEGDSISSGDVICEVETDKATMDYEAMQEGILLKILAHNGASLAIGQPIGIIGESGEDIESLIQEAKKELESAPDAAPGVKRTDAAAQKPATKQAATEVPAPSGSVSTAGHIKASPLARTLAVKYGIDLSTVRGSGPDGRIVKRDIEGAAKQLSTTAAFAAGAGTAEAMYTPQDEVKPVSRKRRIIAQRLAESKFGAPHYYLKISAGVDTLLEARKQLNTGRKEDKVSFNAYMLKLAAETLKRHPAVRSTWQGDSILTHGSIDIGLAVAQPDGLITPVVKNCGGKGILQIDSELKDLIARAQQGKLSPEEYQGAVFTITNLGSFGIEEFTAIINPPGSAILAVGSIMKQQVFGDDDHPEIQSMMKMTLSCDHRVIDGAVGAHFLRDLKNSLENPITALY